MFAWRSSLHIGSHSNLALGGCRIGNFVNSSWGNNVIIIIDAYIGVLSTCCLHTLLLFLFTCCLHTLLLFLFTCCLHRLLLFLFTLLLFTYIVVVVVYTDLISPDAVCLGLSRETIFRTLPHTERLSFVIIDIHWPIPWHGNDIIDCTIPVYNSDNINVNNNNNSIIN